jgi:hypothetical protein
LSGIEINRTTIFAMQPHPDSENTRDAVLSLPCDPVIAYLNEDDLPPAAHATAQSAEKIHLRLAVAMTLDAAAENLFTVIDAAENRP